MDKLLNIKEALEQGFHSDDIEKVANELGIDLPCDCIKRARKRFGIERDLTKLHNIFNGNAKSVIPRDKILFADKLIYDSRFGDPYSRNGVAHCFKAADAVIACGNLHTRKMFATLLAHTVENKNIKTGVYYGQVN